LAVFIPAFVQQHWNSFYLLTFATSFLTHNSMHRNTVPLHLATIGVARIMVLKESPNFISNGASAHSADKSLGLMPRWSSFRPSLRSTSPHVSTIGLASFCLILNGLEASLATMKLSLTDKGQV
jgi:hypothetical protein